MAVVRIVIAADPDPGGFRGRRVVPEPRQDRRVRRSARSLAHLQPREPDARGEHALPVRVALVLMYVDASHLTPPSVGQSPPGAGPRTSRCFSRGAMCCGACHFPACRSCARAYHPRAGVQSAAPPQRASRRSAIVRRRGRRGLSRPLGSARQGPEGGRARLHVERRHRGRLDGARVQPRRDARLRHRRGRGRVPGADHHGARVHSDALRRARLQVPEPGRPGLRHDVHLVLAGVRPDHGLARRLGRDLRRRPRDGEPVADRGRLHLRPLRHDERGGQQVLGRRRRRDLDPPDGADLLRRHRGLGPDAVGPARRGDRDPRHLLGRRAHQGLDAATRPGAFIPR